MIMFLNIFPMLWINRDNFIATVSYSFHNYSISNSKLSLKILRREVSYTCSNYYDFSTIQLSPSSCYTNGFSGDYWFTFIDIFHERFFLD